MENTIPDLTQEVKKEQTSFNDKNITAPEFNLSTPSEEVNEFDQMLSTEFAKKDSEQEVADTFDYTTELPHVLLERKELLNIIYVVGAILNNNAHKAVGRGISLQVIDKNKVELVTPGELYYFKTVIDTECDLPVGDVIFLEYLFLQKIAKFLPPKILITKNTQEVTGMLMDKYFIRLTTDELELLNSRLIQSDVERLKEDFTVGELVKELPVTSIASSLETLFKVLPFQADTKRREISVQDNKCTFKSSQVYVSSDCDMINLKLRKAEVDYILRLAKYADQNSMLKIYKVTKGESALTHYLLELNNIKMVTNYSDPSTDVILKEAMSDLPELFEINYSNLKYQLEYANSITYALGQITMSMGEDQLEGSIKLNGGSTSPFTLPTTKPMILPKDTKFIINSKTLLNCINALDPTLQLSVGYKQGFLYLVNSSVTLIMITT